MRRSDRAPAGEPLAGDSPPWGESSGPRERLLPLLKPVDARRELSIPSDARLRLPPLNWAEVAGLLPPSGVYGVK